MQQYAYYECVHDKLSDLGKTVRRIFISVVYTSKLQTVLFESHTTLLLAHP